MDPSPSRREEEAAAALAPIAHFTELKLSDKSTPTEAPVALSGAGGFAASSSPSDARALEENARAAAGSAATPAGAAEGLADPDGSASDAMESEGEQEDAEMHEGIEERSAGVQPRERTYALTEEAARRLVAENTTASELVAAFYVAIRKPPC